MRPKASRALVYQHLYLCHDHLYLWINTRSSLSGIGQLLLVPDNIPQGTDSHVFVGLLACHNLPAFKLRGRGVELIRSIRL